MGCQEVVRALARASPARLGSSVAWHRMVSAAAAAVVTRRGPLLVRLSEEEEAGGEAWSSSVVTLTDSELVVERGSERRALLLTVDQYCGDCSQRPNAFLLSDLVDTVYLCAETAEAKRIWMVALAGALRRLGTRKALLAAEEREHGPVHGAPQEDEPPGAGAFVRSAEPPSEAAVRLERASAQLAAAERLLALCTAMREESVVRAGRAAAAAARHSASAERERAERARTEREAELARRRAEEADRARERAARLEEERRRDAEQQAAMRAVREERARAEARAAEELIAQKNAQAAKRRSLELAAKPLKKLPSNLPSLDVDEGAQEQPPPPPPVQPASPRAGKPVTAASKPTEPLKPSPVSPSKPPLAPAPHSPQPQHQQPASGISSKVKLWSDKTSEFQNKQAENPFSGKTGATSPNNRPSQRDEDYGKAKPGSKTEERAIAAQKWVEVEVDKLCAEIRKIGRPDPSGRVLVEFGKLFLHYEKISDTLVGIMMRAKKRGRIEYAGDMLFQSKDDAVIVTLLSG